MGREGFDLPQWVTWGNGVHDILDKLRDTFQDMLSSSNPWGGYVLLTVATLCARMLCTAPENTPWAGASLISATILGERRFSIKLCCFLIIQMLVMKMLDYQALAASLEQQTPVYFPKIGFSDAVIIWLYTFSGPIVFWWARFMGDTWMPVFTSLLNLQLLPSWLEAIERSLKHPTKETMMAALFLWWEVSTPILASMVALLSWDSTRNLASKIARSSLKGLLQIRSQWVLAGPILVATKQFGRDSYAPPGSYSEETLKALTQVFLYFFLSETWRPGVILMLLSSALQSTIHMMGFINDMSLASLTLLCANFLPLAFVLSQR